MEMAKKLIVGQSEWSIADADAPSVFKLVRDAVTTGGSVELPVLDQAGRPVQVLLNAKAAPTVVLDLDGGPRPSEMS
jgi:hypothetical protein